VRFAQALLGMRAEGAKRLQPGLQVYRLAYNGDVAAGQLAVFLQGASEAPISG